MAKDHKFDMMVNKKHQKRMTEFGKKHGYSSLAKLTHKAWEIVFSDPSLLHAIEVDETKEILESVQEYFSIFDDISDALKNLTARLEIQDKRLGSLVESNKRIMKNQGATDKEIEEVLPYERDGSEVF